MPNTDYTALECAPSGSRRARWVYILHQAIVLGGLLGGGMSIGYFAGVQTTREAAIEELGRLQHNHQTALDLISGRQGRAADKLEAAADTAAAAAETAQGAATIAGKVAKAAGVPAAAIERDRKAINSTIQRANERIAGEGAR